VKIVRDAGEPLSRGQVDRRAADARALRDALLFVALFTGVVLINGILAILFIALMQALGLWTPVAVETAFLSAESPDEMRTSLLSLTDRRPAAPP
jgi:hypothetical protein